MIKNALTIFKSAIDSIRNHISVTKKIRLYLTKNKDCPDIKDIIAHYSDEKNFNYRSNVISLYGAFEKYVESLIAEYVSCYQKLVHTFDESCGKIKKDYFGNWKKLHGKISYPKYSSWNEKN